ncbi:OmpH family outer membrane protein [Flavobacterium sp. P21]|uniref:OmpH family outer membrane protein n=1 Tax=Flavobacterium sp. P21 TaxID=3423948 RepID=UPI003D677710
MVFKYYASTTTKVVYVDNSKLFENFTMTRELKISAEREFNIMKTNTDSLFNRLQNPQNSGSQKKGLMLQFLQSKENLEKFNENFASDQSLKIWARIKSYSLEFSQENNYDLIIGSEKTNILFASEKIDVTNELLTYINKKYEGI